MKTNRMSIIRTGILVLGTSLCLSGVATTGLAQSSLPPVAIRYVDQMLEGGSLQVATSLIAPDAVLETPEGSFLGQEGVNAFTTQLETSFSDLDFDIDNVTFDDDDLVIAFTMSGVQTGNYQGVAPRCAGVSVSGTAVLDLNGGVVGDQEITYDQALLVQQAARFNQMASWEGLDCTTLRPTIEVAESDSDGPESACIKDDQCQLP